MEEITFLDALSHYETKLDALSQELERIKYQLNLSRQVLDETWKGPASEACKAKLDTLQPELNRVLSELSDARIRLGGIGELWQDEQAALITEIS